MPDVSAGGSAADPAAGGSPADSALSGRQAISMHTVKRTEIVLLCADFLFRFIFSPFYVILLFRKDAEKAYDSAGVRNHTRKEKKRSGYLAFESIENI